MRLAKLRAQLVQEDPRRAVDGARPAPRRSARTWRWAVVIATVLALAVGTSLAAAAAGPGQPFYHLRLALESVTLPPQGTARIGALLGHLDTRLAEARQASARGDHAAVADALAAYEATLSTLTDTVATSGADQSVLDQLARHVAILEGLRDRLPPQAQPGVERALEQTQRARDAISQRPASPPDQPAPGAAPPDYAPPEMPPGMPPGATWLPAGK